MKWPILAVACAALTAAGSATAARGDAPFVVTYACDGGRHLAVGYPAYRDAARAPIDPHLAGPHDPAPASRMVGSGARYLNALSNLEWWSKGGGGTLSQIQPSRPLLTNCVADSN